MSTFCYIKVKATYLKEILKGNKKAIILKNNRFFKVGDILILYSDNIFKINEKRNAVCEVTHILHYDKALKLGNVMLSFKLYQRTQS